MATHKPPLPVNYAKVDALGRFGPATWANVFYLLVNVWDVAHANDAIELIYDAMHALYNTTVKDSVTPDWHLTTYKVLFRTDDGNVERATLADAIAGEGSPGDQAAQVAYLINWSTPDPRKGGKPRQYIPGVPDDQMADSANLTAGCITGWNAGLATWLEDNVTRTHGTANGIQLVEMSFRDALTWRDTALPYPIRAGAVSPQVATQRRRVDRLRS